MKYESFLSNCLDAHHLEAIGLVAAESAWLERTVEYYIQRLARLTRKKTDAFLESRMMSSKLELLKMLGRASLKDPKRRDEFSDLIAQVVAANTDRNTVIHGVWQKHGRGIIDMARLPFAAKRTSPGNHKTMSATEINRVATDINRAVWNLLLFGQEHWPTTRQTRDARLLAALRSRGKT